MLQQLCWKSEIILIAPYSQMQLDDAGNKPVKCFPVWVYFMFVSGDVAMKTSVPAGGGGTSRLAA